MLTKIISGDTLRKSRLHNEKGNNRTGGLTSDLCSGTLTEANWDS